MHWPQMKDRCPSARFVGAATLSDYRLAFSRRSLTRGCGVADAVSTAGGRVWGVLYEISDLDIVQLDTSEGHRPGRDRNSYWRRRCTVLMDGDEKQPRTAFTYFADPEPNPPLPSQAYKELIVSGARRWNLPSDYIDELERIEVSR